ncbi:hypothetical protein DFO83_1095 [Idiomarina loihiensis]|uniref:hypothetical protein n=1 Tax=Idiomarina TaxID=135575 RepID=UPI000D70B24F|nr:hypothetical protein [Idiomarina]PWW35225.1 hypothetical protein DFO83_1095 [Idiomarina loihiensis]TDP45165.1 hypothetical protein DET58_1095 [Idiomarina loihiensis]TDS21114.1 hypothetical protein DET62_109127 [Idiomarina sp. H2]
MKFIWHTLKSGAMCFLFTPALMTLLVVLVFQEKVTDDTKFYPWVTIILNMRYSADSFFLMLFISVLFSFFVAMVLKTQEIPRHEKIRLALFFNLIASFLPKLFLFWAGTLVAWSFGSRLLDSIPPVPGQIAAIPLFIFLAVACRFGTLKLKHYLIKG